jgi:hypothetical protein
MGIFEFADGGIRASLARFELVEPERLLDSTTVMDSFRRVYQKGSIAQIDSWCGKNATQPDSEAASILKTEKVFKAGEAHWVKERTRNRRSRNHLNFQAWDCTRARL